MVAGPGPARAHGSDNTVRLPAIPTGSPPATLPTIQPGAEIVEPGPFILESRRNAGLEGDERTNTDRARQAARRGDPEVTAILSDSEWRAHHLIPMELIRKGHSVLRGAARAGFKTDEDANVAAVPNSPAAQEKLRRAGINRPVDDSGHPDWNDAEKAELDTIKEELDRDYGLEDSPGKDRAARSELEKLLRQERLRLMGLQRITEGADTSSSSNG